MRSLVLAVLALVLAGQSTPAAAAPLTEISVTGSGEISMMPDQATVNATIVTNATESTDAVSANNRAYDRIVAALGRLGIGRPDIALSNYAMNYNPRPAILPSPPTGDIYGYTVSRSFSVKVRSIAKTGPVSDALTAAGVTQIDGVGFGLANEAGARAKALAIAVADAAGKAEAVATAARLHLVGIKSMSLDQGGAPPMPMMRLAAMAPANAPTAFDPSSVKVSVSVSVIYLASP